MFLNVFMWNLCKCHCWLITEVILRNARCNSKVYIAASFIHKHTHTHTHNTPHTYTHIHKHTQRTTHIYIHTHHTTHIHTTQHTAHIHIHVYIHTHTYIHPHTHTHTHTHLYFEVITFTTKFDTKLINTFITFKSTD